MLVWLCSKFPPRNIIKYLEIITDRMSWDNYPSNTSRRTMTFSFPITKSSSKLSYFHRALSPSRVSNENTHIEDFLSILTRSTFMAWRWLKWILRVEIIAQIGMFHKHHEILIRSLQQVQHEALFWFVEYENVNMFCTWSREYGWEWSLGTRN